MKKKLTNNLGLKLISLIFSIVLWIVVVNINDPVIPKKFYNIPVSLLNTSSLTEDGKVYEVLDGTDNIGTVTITGQRSIVDSIAAGDIVATANVESDLNEDGTVNINLYCNRYNTKLSNIKGSINKVKLNIEDKKTVQLVLKASTTGNAADGCLIGSVSMDQNLIRIEGPESIVSTIAKASAVVDVSGATSNVATYAEVRLLDAEGHEVVNRALTKNCEQVKVSVEILNTKSVPVVLTASGIPSNGYLSTGVIEVEPQTVMIAGTASNLAKVDVITVPETELDITDQAENMIASVDLDGYLPSGITWADSSFDGKVQATVYIEKAEVKNVTVPNRSLVVVHIPEGMEAKILTGLPEGADGVRVQIAGLANQISEVQETSVVGYIDMNLFAADLGLTSAEDILPGIYQAELLFNNIGETKVVSPVVISLEITDLTAETESESAEEQNAN